MRTDCHDIQQSLGPFLAGDLDAAEMARIETHLGACAECARLRSRLRRLDALLAKVPVPMPSPDEITLMALRARAASHKGGARRAVLAAAAVLAMLLIPAATYVIVTPRRADPVVIDGFGGTFDIDF